MSINRLNPQLLKTTGASDGDVLTYVDANSRIEFKASAGGGGDVSNAWVNANDYATYTTLSSLIDAVQDNLTNSSGTIYASIDSDQFTLDGSTNNFTMSSNVRANSDILVSVSGVVQTPSQYVVSNNQLTLSNTGPLPSGVLLEVRHLYTNPSELTDLSVTTATASGNGALSYDNTSGVFTFTPADTSSGGGGGGITTGKAIAMAMIFGG